MTAKDLERYLKKLGIKYVKVGDNRWLLPWQVKSRMEPLPIILVLTPFSVMAYAFIDVKADPSNGKLLQLLVEANHEKCLGKFALTKEGEILIIFEFPCFDFSKEELAVMLDFLPLFFDEYYPRILETVHVSQEKDIFDQLA